MKKKKCNIKKVVVFQKLSFELKPTTVMKSVREVPREFVEYNYAKILLENIKESCTQFFKEKTFAALKNSDSVSESRTLPSLIKKIKGFENKTIEKSFIHKNLPVCQLRKLIQSKERSSAKKLMEKFNMENNE